MIATIIAYIESVPNALLSFGCDSRIAGGDDDNDDDRSGRRYASSSSQQFALFTRRRSQWPLRSVMGTPHTVNNGSDGLHSKYRKRTITSPAYGGILYAQRTMGSDLRVELSKDPAALLTANLITTIPSRAVTLRRGSYPYSELLNDF